MNSVLIVTPQTIAHQAPLSMRFHKQEYWSGLPFPSAENLPDPGIEPSLLHWQADSLPLYHRCLILLNKEKDNLSHNFKNSCLWMVFAGHQSLLFILGIALLQGNCYTDYSFPGLLKHMAAGHTISGFLLKTFFLLSSVVCVNSC